MKVVVYDDRGHQIGQWFFTRDEGTLLIRKEDRLDGGEGVSFNPNVVEIRYLEDRVRELVKRAQGDE